MTSSYSLNDPEDQTSPHSDQRLELGAQGEQIALTYLEESGYILEAKNWRGQRGELDLIMRRCSSLVIVEVRTTSTRWLDRPAEATPISKQRQVARCADEYCHQRHPSAPEIFDIRFDVIGVLMNPDSLHAPEIDHVENAYYSPFAF
jgi:putative endonuclease